MKSESSHFGSKSTQEQVDVWSESHDSDSHAAGGRAFSLTPERAKQEKASEPLASYRVNTLDTSLSGYCLNWRSDMPAQARVGEVLGLKELQRNRWSVGVIRWVQQSNRGTQMGAQLLAPMAEAVEIAMINIVGDDSLYMRALILPALKVANQPATLLCASMPFREHCKVNLKRGKNSSKLQLTRKLLATSSVSQFEFRQLESDSEAENEETIAKPAANFDDW